MEDIEKKLDLLCLQLLEILAEIDEKKQLQEKQLKDGCLFLAKTRYAIGVDRISKLHYAATMNPSLTVLYNNSEEKFDVLHSNQTAKTTEKLTEHSLETKLRRRIVQEKNNENETDAKDNESSQKTEPLDFVEDIDKPKIGFDDPIRWFGALAPQPLRNAQATFIQAIQTSCDICNLERKLESTRSKYSSARKIQASLDAKMLSQEQSNPQSLS